MLECVALVRFARACAQRARLFLRAHANETNAQAAGDPPMQALVNITNAQASATPASFWGASAAHEPVYRTSADVACFWGASAAHEPVYRTSATVASRMEVCLLV